jgi:hypothetical protein
LSRHFRQDTVDGWLRRLREAGLLAAEVKTFAEVVPDVAELSPGLVELEDGRGVVRNPIQMVGSARPPTEPYRVVDRDEFRFRGSTDRLRVG